MSKKTQQTKAPTTMSPKELLMEIRQAIAAIPEELKTVKGEKDQAKLQEAKKRLEEAERQLDWAIAESGTDKVFQRPIYQKIIRWFKEAKASREEVLK